MTKFLGELLRMLEEDGIVHATAGGWILGDLTRVAVSRLLRQVIDGRLLRLGEEVRDLLATGAVIGREIPFALWAVVAETDEAMLLNIVERGAAATLVEETRDGTWLLVATLASPPLFTRPVIPRAGTVPPLKP